MIKNEETLNNYKKYVNECSLSLKKYVEKESVDFLFIDANHRHPWPCVDILFAIEYLSNDSVICLHDINLPSVNKNFQSFGVKYIFDELMEIFHYTVSTDDIPNIGAINISGKHQKQELKQIVKNCISLYKWETDIVNDEVKNALNVLLEE